MAAKILIEEYKNEKAIELPDGTILDLPDRTAEVYEKIIAIDKERQNMTEYEYCKKVLETLYGKNGFKKIAPKEKQTNLDYLERVQLVSLELFLQEKNDAEKEQLEKQAERLEPFAERLSALRPMMELQK